MGFLVILSFIILIMISFSRGKWFDNVLHIKATANAPKKFIGYGNFSEKIGKQLSNKSFQLDYMPFNQGFRRFSTYPLETTSEASNKPKRLTWAFKNNYSCTIHFLAKKIGLSKLCDFPTFFKPAKLGLSSRRNSTHHHVSAFNFSSGGKVRKISIACKKYKVSSLTKRNFGFETCRALEDQLSTMYDQFDRLQKHLQHEQHWSSMVQSASDEKQCRNKTSAGFSPKSISIWRMNSGSLIDLLADKPFSSHCRVSYDNIPANITKHIGENVSFNYNTLSQRWPFIRAQCQITQLHPKQVLKVLWCENSASELLQSRESTSSFSTVSLEHRYDLLRFDDNTKLVWSRFKFPWSAKNSNEQSSTENELRSNDVSGELLSLSHYFFDSHSQSYILMSQSVAPPLAQAIMHSQGINGAKYCKSAQTLKQILSNQLKRSHVRLSLSLLSPLMPGSQSVGTELTQLSQTQWQNVPVVIVWRSVVPATISYLKNVKRLAPLLYKTMNENM